MALLWKLHIKMLWFSQNCNYLENDFLGFWLLTMMLHLTPKIKFNSYPSSNSLAACATYLEVEPTLIQSWWMVQGCRFRRISRKISYLFGTQVLIIIRQVPTKALMSYATDITFQSPVPISAERKEKYESTSDDIWNKIYYTVNRLRSFLSSGHLGLSGHMGHLV